MPRWFSFRHPLVRRTVYETTRAGWRIAAHARAAAELERRGAPAADRARHIEQCAAPGDEEAIALLIAAGEQAAPRAPATAARWFEAALRLLHGDDHERQVDVRVALASALRSTGELDRSRALLLEAADLLPAGAHARRVELVASCAAVEHWLGHHEAAHDRLIRAWDELPAGDGPEAAALLVELAVDALYRADYAEAGERAARSLAIAQALGAAAPTAAAAAALTLAEAAQGHAAVAEAHREVALAALEQLSDAELAPHLEALYNLCWAENYLEHYDTAVARADRALAIARATGAGRMLVPLTLVKAYPFEMQGHMAATIELCETALEAERLAPNPHYRFWALFELGWARYYAGDPDGAIDACEESAALGHRMRGGTMPSTGGGPGWALGTARLAVGELERAAELLYRVGGEQLEHMVPVERCFDWEELVLLELRRGDLARAEAHAAACEADAARIGLRLPAALAKRGRAAVQLAQGDHAAAAASARASAEDADAIGAGLQAAYSRLLLGQVLAAAGERDEAIAVLRAAERALDGFASIRPRDEARRELRRLGARTEVRGPATRADSGVDALTQARARDRRARHRPQDEPPDRRDALPLGQDDRVAPAQRVRQARRVLADGGRARDRPPSPRGRALGAGPLQLGLERRRVEPRVARRRDAVAAQGGQHAGVGRLAVDDRVQRADVDPEQPHAAAVDRAGMDHVAERAGARRARLVDEPGEPGVALEGGVHGSHARNLPGIGSPSSAIHAPTMRTGPIRPVSFAHGELRGERGRGGAGRGS